jgi:hypothetical protein
VNRLHIERQDARGKTCSTSYLMEPVPGIGVPVSHESKGSLPRKNLLFVGHGRTYKGLDLLLAAWPPVGDL